MRTGFAIALIFCSFLLSTGEDVPEWAKLIPKDDYDAIRNRPTADPAAGVDALLGGLFLEDIVGCGLKGKPSCKVAGDASTKWRKIDDGITIISYTASPDLSVSVQDVLSAAVDAITDQVPCLVFRNEEQETAVTPILAFESNTVCAAQWGGIPSDSLKIYLADSCVGDKAGNVQRLIMLALGFSHEINRRDRDDYVNIIWDNVDPAKRNQLTKDGPDAAYVTGYDYDSVLHPDYVFLSSARNIPTLTGKDKVVKLGQRDGLSKGDVKKLSAMFCTAKTSGMTPTDPPQEDTVVQPTKVEKPSSTLAATPPVTTVVLTTEPETPAPTAAPLRRRKKRPTTAASAVETEEAPASEAPQTTTTENTETETKASIQPTTVRHCEEGMVNGITDRYVISMVTALPDGSVTDDWVATSKVTRKWQRPGLPRDMLQNSLFEPETSGKVQKIRTLTDNTGILVLETVFKPVVQDGLTVTEIRHESRILGCSKSMPKRKPTT